MRIGNYEISAELARGNMGVVYRARDAALGREVAIKLMRSSLQADRVLRERFEREAEALARLRHPNVVRVHELGDHEGSAYLVTEFISGESLQNRIDRRRFLREHEAATLTLKLAQALEAAHEQSLIHRDVKPANVIVEHDGTPRLTDFGLARDLAGTRGRLTPSGTALGTPGYWAPEQAMGALAKQGPHTDVYGLGATLYAMLTGRPPLQATNAAETLEAIKRPPRPIREQRPNVDPGLEAICMRCLEPEPGARFKAMPELAADLERYLADRSVRSAQGVSIRRLQGWLLRYSVATGVAAVGLLGVVLLLAIALPSVPDVPPTRTSEGTDPDPTGSEAPAQAEIQAAWQRARQRARSRAYDAALDDYRFVLRELPPASALAAQVREETALTYVARARAAIETGTSSLARALGDLELASDVAPGSAPTHTQCGELYWELADARLGFLDGLAIGTGQAERRARREALRSARGFLRDALDSFRAALELAPDTGRSRALLGAALFHLGRYEEAKQELERALKASPNDPESLYVRGRTQFELGDPRGASEDYQAALAALDRAPAKANTKTLARLELAQAVAWSETGDSARAAAACQRVLGRFGENTPIGRRARGLLDRISDPD